ncbi:hypothetical protein ACJZ2D_015005 [Fusarium nematophilum]
MPPPPPPKFHQGRGIVYIQIHPRPRAAVRQPVPRTLEVAVAHRDVLPGRDPRPALPVEVVAAPALAPVLHPRPLEHPAGLQARLDRHVVAVVENLPGEEPPAAGLRDAAVVCEISVALYYSGCSGSSGGCSGGGCRAGGCSRAGARGAADAVAVQLEAVPCSAELRLVTRAREGAVLLVVGLDAPVVDLVAAEALASVLGTEVGVAVAEGGARLERHVVLCVAALVESADADAFGPAALEVPCADLFGDFRAGGGGFGGGGG